MVPNRNGAVTSAVLVHLRVEPAHFDWRWRERPALALLVWEALVRDPLARLRRIQLESTGTTINFRPAAITHRDFAASALLIASSVRTTSQSAGSSWIVSQDWRPAIAESCLAAATAGPKKRCGRWTLNQPVDRSNQRFGNVSRFTPKLVAPPTSPPALTIVHGSQKRGGKYG
jgi:hypothetical protein